MTLADLPDVPLPDDVARTDASRGLAELDLPGAGFGALVEPVGWAAAVQGRGTPEPFRGVRVVLLAGDHAGGVAAGSPPDSGRQAAAELAGVGPLARLAVRAGATLEVVDAALGGAPLAPDLTTRIRDGAAAIEESDACTGDEAATGFTVGRTLADSLADSGVDLIVMASLGVGVAGAAAATAAFMTGAEPAALLATVAGPDGSVDDTAWMRRCAAVRDALARVRRLPRDPHVALGALAGPDIAVATGLLVGAAARRTPLLLDGPVGLVAALLARDLAGQATHWCLVPDTCRHPTTTAVASRIGLEPFLDLRLDLGEGAAALTALGVLQSALDLVSALPAAARESPAAEPSPGQPSPSEPEQR
ncbi:MAG TPA: nicotinate-nucleotide--dimethylbenzimidazole phosphoribosyltransferase [Micromonosporaceae bacterium]